MKLGSFIIKYPLLLLKETVFLSFSTKRSWEDPGLMALNVVALTS